MKNFRIIVAGSRNFTDYELVKAEVLDFVNAVGRDCEITIVSGGSKGVDKMGEKLADEMHWQNEIFKANWGMGHGAGPARNTQMAKSADALIAFWDMSSPGTKDIVAKAQKANLKIKIVKI